MSIATAVLLAGYFAVAVRPPFPSSDPQRGMADGFIILVTLILLSFGGALWFGVARNHPWVIRTIFVVTVLPAISQLAQSIFPLRASCAVARKLFGIAGQAWFAQASGVKLER
jgi:hypothetical protein